MKKKGHSKSAWLSKQLNEFALKRNIKLPGKSHRRKMKRAGDDLNVSKKECRHVHGKKGKRPSEAVIFSAVHATASGTCQKKVEGTMSHNAVILWFI